MRDVKDSSDFATLINSGALTVVDFTATWCGPCRRVAPLFEALATRYPAVTFAKVWEHQCRELVMSCGVRAFPTFQFYIAGRKVDECTGGNIRQVEAKVLQHMGSALAAGAKAGPISVKLRAELEKERAGGGTVLVFEEMDIEVDAADGLDVLRFQILSLTEIEPEEQEIAGGDGTPIATDAALAAALAKRGGGHYGNSAALQVRRRVAAKTKLVAKPVAAAPAEAVGGAESWRGCCSRALLGDRPLRQPAGVIREERWAAAAASNGAKGGKGSEPVALLCRACGDNWQPRGRVEAAPAVSASLLFVCEGPVAASRGIGTYPYAEALSSGKRQLPQGSPAAKAVEASLLAAADTAAAAMSNSGRGEAEMRGRIASGVQSVLRYEDPVLQARAISVIPAEKMREAAAAVAAVGGVSYEEALALELLKWFKKDFFKWCDKPPCGLCGAKPATMAAVGNDAPTAQESAGGAGRVEVYSCKTCGSHTRFARYNDPGTLLETRRGRCGEFANCFTLICRAMGLEARWVLDLTDHVWTEIRLPRYAGGNGHRWVHADPCENKLDKPLMYEQGWGKRLSYVIAFGRGAVVDVTPRYTRRWRQVLTRRNQVTEAFLAGEIAAATRRLQGSVTISATTAGHLRGGGTPPSSGYLPADLSAESAELSAFKAAESGEMERPLSAEELEGRQSGDAAWVASRGEDGGGAGSFGNGNFRVGEGAVALAGLPLAVPYAAGTLLRVEVSAAAVSGDARGRLAARLGGGQAAKISCGGSPIIVDGSGACAGILVVALAGGSGAVLRNERLTGREGNSAGEQLAELLAELPLGVVVAVGCSGQAKPPLLGSRALAALAALLPPAAAASVKEPVPGAPWALLGWRGHGGGGFGCYERREAGEGAVRLAAEVAFPGGKIGANSEQAFIARDDCIGAAVFAQLPAEEAAAVVGGGAAAAQPLLAAAAAKWPGSGTITGVSYRAGQPALLLGPSPAGLVPTAGWTTWIASPHPVTVSSAAPAGAATVPAAMDSSKGPSAAAAEKNSPEDLASKVKALFAELVATGMDPTEAAAHAIKRVSELPPPPPQDEVAVEVPARVQAKVEGADDSDTGAVPTGWRILRLSGAVGGVHDDTEQFSDDSWAGNGACGVAGRGSAAAPAAAATEVVGWSGDFVNGLQVKYLLGGAQLSAARHIGEHGEYRQASLPMSANGLRGAKSANISSITIKAGAILDGLVVKLSDGKERSWGSADGTGRTLVVPDGYEFVGFYGGVGGHIHHLGLVMVAASGSLAASKLQLQPGKLSVEVLRWAYSGDAVGEAAAAIAAAAATGDPDAAAAAATALETALKYALNIAKDPKNPKFLRVRLANPFYQKNLGTVPGSGYLIRALGFAAEAEGSGELWFAFEPAKLPALLQACDGPLAALAEAARAAADGNKT